jgi:hypothetical protein
MCRATLRQDELASISAPNMRNRTVFPSSCSQPHAIHHHRPNETATTWHHHLPTSSQLSQDLIVPAARDLQRPCVLVMEGRPPPPLTIREGGEASPRADFARLCPPVAARGGRGGVGVRCGSARVPQWRSRGNSWGRGLVQYTCFA